MKSIRLLLLLASGVTTGAFAQSGGLTDMSQSRFAKMANTELGAVHWTDGFWGDRFNVYSHTSLQSMWDTWNNPDVSHGFRNFEIGDLPFMTVICINGWKGWLPCMPSRKIPNWIN